MKSLASINDKDIQIIKMALNDSISDMNTELKGEISEKSNEEAINVFVPTSPNPTTGFLLMIAKKDLVFLDMSVEDGLKMIISFGMVKAGKKKQPEKKQEELENSR